MTGVQTCALPISISFLIAECHSLAHESNWPKLVMCLLPDVCIFSHWKLREMESQRNELKDENYRVTERRIKDLEDENKVTD